MKEGFGLATETVYTGLERSFQTPPFTVLSSRDGWWQKRKRLWIKLGIKSELGREKISNGNSTQTTTCCATDWMKRGPDAGGSVFDPVLCELAYKWFCPTGGSVVDPFAGGSVRGIVSAFLGYRYWGCELRKEQVTANVVQGAQILQNNLPIWHCGDSSTDIRRFAPEADFVFSCPPYGDLEVYSDDPKDISNKTYHEFIEIYSKIIKHSCRKLKQDRFACFVVTNYRDKEGFYHNFVGDTITIFEENGCKLYNDAILMTPTGSLPIRVTKQFQSGRKLGKTHQNIIVFYKGDPKNIKKNFGNLTNLE